MSFGEIVTWPFVKVMVFFYGLTHSYGLSLILFSFLVNLVLMPFMAKSKKSMMRTTRLQPRIQEIQRRHEGNQQKLNAEMQKLYQEEGVNPLGGCLWSLLPLFLLIPLYSIIRLPITRMMGASSSVVEALSEKFSAELSGMGNRVAAYKEIILTNLAHTTTTLTRPPTPLVSTPTANSTTRRAVGEVSCVEWSRPTLKPPTSNTSSFG